MVTLAQGALKGQIVKLISAGDSHMAALCSSGRVYSWGTYKDSNGYIGYSPQLLKASEPTLVSGLPEIETLACGADHTIAVTRDGKIPIPMRNIIFCAHLSLGTHSFADKAAHEIPYFEGYNIYTWGCGEKGQLGRGIQWDASLDKEGKKRYLQPSEPFDIRLHAGVALDARDRLKLALNENLLIALRKKVAAEPTLDLTEACNLYLEHRAKLDQARPCTVKVTNEHARARAVHSHPPSCAHRRMSMHGCGECACAHTCNLTQRRRHTHA